MSYKGLIKKSRTLDLAAILTVLGAVQVALPQMQLDPQWHGWATLIVGVLVAYLRCVTTAPVGGK